MIGNRKYFKRRGWNGEELSGEEGRGRKGHDGVKWPFLLNAWIRRAYDES